MIDYKTIQDLAPAVLTTSPSPKVSDKYSFVPTFDVVEKFINDGWELSSARQMGKNIYALHEVKVRNGKLDNVGDTIVELIITNSHNGLVRLSISAGLFRLVCKNGLVIPSTLVSPFTLKHKNFDYGDFKILMSDFSDKIPMIGNSVNKMMNRELTESERFNFVREATSIRGKEDYDFTSSQIESILNPVRSEDNKKDLWTTFNIVQEKFVKGMVKYEKNGKERKLRPLSRIIATNTLNTKLWTLAENLI